MSNNMPKIQIPENQEKIMLQISALEMLIEGDTNDKDKQIHETVLNDLQKALIQIRSSESIEKQRLFVDMDGTLAIFTPVDELETLYEQGYFLKLEPIDNVVQAIKRIIWNYPDVEVNILSAHLSDSPWALAEKNAWLDKYLPEVDFAHRIFPPCGCDKKDYIPGGVRETDFLLDDYTHNLNLWQPPARGIKLLNGINHTRGSWEHDRIRHDHIPEELTLRIINIMQGNSHIYDEKPIVTKEVDVEWEHEV